MRKPTRWVCVKQKADISASARLNLASSKCQGAYSASLSVSVSGGVSSSCVPGCCFSRVALAPEAFQGAAERGAPPPRTASRSASCLARLRGKRQGVTLGPANPPRGAPLTRARPLSAGRHCSPERSAAAAEAECRRVAGKWPESLLEGGGREGLQGGRGRLAALCIGVGRAKGSSALSAGKLPREPAGQPGAVRGLARRKPGAAEGATKARRGGRLRHSSIAASRGEKAAFPRGGGRHMAGIANAVSATFAKPGAAAAAAASAASRAVLGALPPKPAPAV